MIELPLLPIPFVAEAHILSVQKIGLMCCRSFNGWHQHILAVTEVFTSSVHHMLWSRSDINGHVYCTAG